MNKTRKVVLASIASVLLVVAVIVTTLLFGYTSPPKYVSLSKHPDPNISGVIAYQVDEDLNQCTYVVPAAGGEVRKVVCDDYLDVELAFSNRGDIVVASDERLGFYDERRITVYDSQSLQKKDSFSIPRQPGLPDTPVNTLTVSSDDYSYDGIFDSHEGPYTAWVATDADGKDRLVSKRVPSDYRFESAERSPDEKWLLIRDSNGRVLVAEPHGAISELVGASRDDYFYASPYNGGTKWFMPGHTDATVDVDALKKNTIHPTRVEAAR